jgi:uncharacterized protein YkwD
MKLTTIITVAAVALIALTSVGHTQTTPAAPQTAKAPATVQPKSQPVKQPATTKQQVTPNQAAPAKQNPQTKAPTQATPNTKTAITTQPAVTRTVTPQTQPASFALHPVEQQVIDQTNAERARYGLPPLMADQQLIQSARAHGTWMARSRRMQHTSRPVAENIAMGQNSASEAVRSWMSSSGHRANILSRGHRRIGVSAYTSSNGTVYWTQQFEP